MTTTDSDDVGEAADSVGAAVARINCRTPSLSMFRANWASMMTKSLQVEGTGAVSEVWDYCDLFNDREKMAKEKITLLLAA